MLWHIISHDLGRGPGRDRDGEARGVLIIILFIIITPISISRNTKNTHNNMYAYIIY